MPECRLMSSLAFCILATSLLLAGCGSPAARTGASGGPESPTTVSRADPGFLQWLERQSLLGGAPEAAVVVSGSEIGWRAPGNPPSPALLLDEADMWLEVEPRLLLTGGKRSSLAELAEPPVFNALRASGMTGIYLSSTAEAGAVWGYDRTASTTGDDVTGHGLAEEVGSEDDYARLVRTAGKARTMLGGDLVPASTGLGPDFFLGARGVRDYPGVYCIIEIPHEDWALLPPAEGEWRGVPLSPAQFDALVGKGILPPRLARDDLNWVAPGGWASTGEVRGADGTLRRWIYRYHKRPGRPVLNWNDPTATARRVLSASAIRQVGLRRLPLVGVELLPLAGLEAAGRTASPEPLPEAARSIGREVRRYGGWAWLRDVLPHSLLREIMESGPDFVTDPVSTTTVEHALLTGDASALRDCIDSALATGLDFSRFVHTLPGPAGVDYALPQLMAAGHAPLAPGGLPGALAQAHMLAEMHRKVMAWGAQAPVIGNVLYASGPSIAAIAAGLAPGDAAKQEHRTTIIRNHLSLTAFRAGQPGILMMPADNLAGTLPLTWEHAALRPESWRKEQAARGAWSPMPPISGLAITRSGVPKAPVAYEPAALQAGVAGSFVEGVARLATIRKETGVARGSVVARPATAGAGVAALLVRLPGSQGHMLTIANFAASPVTEHVSIGKYPDMDATTRGTDLLDPAFTTTGTQVDIPLAPRQCRMLLLR